MSQENSPQESKRKFPFDQEEGSREISSKKTKKQVFGIEQEAEESEDDYSDGDDENEDEDDDEDNYYDDGFVVMDDDEEDPNNNKKKKKDKSKERMRLKKLKVVKLDEEDEELIRENNAKFTKTLFDEDEYQAREAKDDNLPYVGDEESDPDDFIDDGFEGEEGVERPKKSRASRSYMTQGHSYATTQQTEDANNVFGVGFDEFDDFGDEEEGDREEGEEEGEEKVQVKSKGTNFEYFQYIQNFLLEEDEEIRIKDIPERFQLYNQGFPEVDPLDFTLQVDWATIQIANQMLDDSSRSFETRRLDILVDMLRPSIDSILRFLKFDKFEAPFIWNYRRDYLHPLITRDDIWKVYFMDEKWFNLHLLRKKLLICLENISNLSEASPLFSLIKLFPLEEYRRRIEEATDENALNDVLSFLKLLNAQFSQSLNSEVEGSTKPHRKESKYFRLKKSPVVQKFVGLICAPIASLSNALENKIKIPAPEYPEFSSIDQFVDEILSESNSKQSLKSLIESATKIIGTEITFEPTLHYRVRSILRKHGCLSTSPTKKGAESITPFSEHFGLHYIQNKSINELYRHDGLILFMKLLDAEKNGLINISFFLNPKVLIDSLGLFDFILPDETTKYSPNPLPWKNAKISIVNDIVEKYLLPITKDDLRIDLLRLGREAIISEMEREFAQRLLVGPFKNVPPEKEQAIKALLLACPNNLASKSIAGFYSSNDGKPIIEIATIDEVGSVLSHKYISPEFMPQKDDLIKEYLFEYRPQLIVLNSSGGHASRGLMVLLEKKLISDVDKLLEFNFLRRKALNTNEYSDDEEEESSTYVHYNPTVIIVDDDLVNVFKTSSRARTLLPDLSVNATAAVGLARFAKDPLIEYANLWMSTDATGNFGYEVLYLNLHPLQRMVSGVKSRVLKQLEKCVVNAVCDIGVDLNEICRHDHAVTLLAFVAGLGLRKAQALRRSIQSAGFIESRDYLRKQNILGPKVWTNAIGYIRITNLQNIKRGDGSSFLPTFKLNPLDNTRIHPEVYQIAQRICADALEVENDPASIHKTVQTILNAVKKELEKKSILESFNQWLSLWNFGYPKAVTLEDSISNPNRSSKRPVLELNDVLSSLVLDEYVRDLENSTNTKLTIHVEQIKHELRFPWLDLRFPLTSLSPNKLFDLITNETQNTLYVGLKTGCTILDIEGSADDSSSKQRAKVKLDNGLKGSISIYDVIDSRIENGMKLEDYLSIGSYIVAVVIGINKDKFSVQLSVKPSVVEKNEAWWIRNRFNDRYIKDYFEKTLAKDISTLYDRNFDLETALNSYEKQENALDKETKLSAAINNSMKVGNTSPSQAPLVAKNRIFSRVIDHPLFANVDFATAESRLRGKGAGAAIIRPSSKGPDYLTITWAFQENLFKHISIREVGKVAGNLGVSGALYVQEEDLKTPYSDLDELHAMYIQPMNEYVAMIIRDRHFALGSPDEVNAKMRQQLTKDPNHLPYFFRFEPTKPGTFVLTWLGALNPNAEIHSMKIDIRPYGFAVKGIRFEKLSELLVWFKKLGEQPRNQDTQASRGNKVSRFDRPKTNPPPTRTAYPQNPMPNAYYPPPQQGAPPMHGRYPSNPMYPPNTNNYPSYPPRNY